MLTRFEGEDEKRRLVDLLSRQMALTGMAAVAEELAGLVTVCALPARVVLIQQDGDDNDRFFVLSGRVSVQVHGREVAVRGPGTRGERSCLGWPGRKLRREDVLDAGWKPLPLGDHGGRLQLFE